MGVPGNRKKKTFLHYETKEKGRKANYNPCKGWFSPRTEKKCDKKGRKKRVRIGKLKKTPGGAVLAKKRMHQLTNESALQGIEKGRTLG